MNKSKYKIIFLKFFFSIVLLFLMIFYFSHKDLREKVFITLKVKVLSKGDIWFKSDGFKIKKEVISGNSFKMIYSELPQVRINKLSFAVNGFKSDLIIKEISIRSFLRSKKLNGYRLKNFFVKKNFKHVKFRNNNLFIYYDNGNELEINKEIIELINKFGKRKIRFFSISLFIFFIVIFILFKFNNINFFYLKKQRDLILIMLFFFILIFPVVNEFFSIIPTIKLNEKRELVKKPRLGETEFFFYLKKFGKYFSDNLIVKNHMVRINNYINIKYFGLSLTPKILLGRNGWMFLAEENKKRNQVDYFRNSHPFSLTQLEKWRVNLEKRYLKLKKRGIGYYIIFAPSKMTIYPEFMPHKIKKVGLYSRLTQLINYLNKRSFIQIIDVRELLIKAKKLHRVYFKTGSHWNDFGAFIAYEKVINHLNENLKNIIPLKLENFLLKQRVSEGDDFPKMLSLEKIITERNILLIPKNSFTAYLSPYISEGNLIKYSFSICKKRYQTKILYIHDSFISGFKKYFAETFSNIEYFWDYSHTLNTGLINKVNPKIVIDEMAERFLMDFDPGKLEILLK